MKIEQVDFFYVSMPVVTEAGDGSQDALVARVAAGGLVGWGECMASPLTSIAAFVCPMSHGACRPVRDVVLGHKLDSPDDIAALTAAIQLQCMDLLQAPHTFSGIETALWDILGKQRGEPIYRLLGYDRAHPKLPYASQLFGDTPQETFAGCRRSRDQGFRAVKCGWGPFGSGSLEADREQVAAAREGVGAEGTLLVDAGQIWVDDVEAAAARLPMLEEFDVTWLEEPFLGGAYDAYARLAERSGKIRLAGGEAAHNFYMARQLIDYGKIAFVQIDGGRIGGIGPAKQVADYAVAKGVKFVNHTFTSHLTLAASLHPFAGLADHVICEYPVTLQPMAFELTANHLTPDDSGHIVLPDTPGLGIDVDEAALRRYLVEVEITVNGKSLYRTPSI